MQKGFKIFMFHSALEEFKPAELEDVEAQSVAALPKKFNYYAGGHVHYVYQTKYGGGVLAYPGPLYPNNFKELEEYRNGSFFLVDEQCNLEQVPIKVKDVAVLRFFANWKSAFELQEEIELASQKIDSSDKIVLLRISGTLKSGKPSDINFKDIFAKMPLAYFIMKNTGMLQALEIDGVKVENGTVEQVEAKILDQFTGLLSFEGADEKVLISSMMQALDKEKAEGEKVADFEKRLLDDVLKMMPVE